MRVDFVITELFAGGAERCLTEVVIGMTAAGDSVRVFSLGALPTGSQRRLVDRLDSAGIEVQSGNANSARELHRVYSRLKNWLRESKPDLCQTFLFHANVVGTMAAKSVRVPIRLGGIRVAESRPLRLQLERFAVNRMQGLVCVSDAVQRFAARRLKCPRERSVVIPNGVNVDRFDGVLPVAWSSIGWPDDSDVTLFVGRLHPQKGLHLLQQQIDSIAPVNSSRKLLLVGDGPLSPQLGTWANDVGPDRVRVIPWQPDIERWIVACRLLVLPSRYEGMPNVVLEAMAAARPVVCSRVEGIDELLGHARDQQTFNIGDGPAMAALVDTFLSDPLRREQAGSENRSLVRAEFSIPAMVDAYRSHYRTLLTRRLDVL